MKIRNNEVIWEVPESAAARLASTVASNVTPTKESISLDEMLRTKWSHVSCFARPILRYAVHQTRAGVARREYGKSMQVHVHSSFKHAYRRLAKLCVEYSILPEMDLLYFFTHSELKLLIESNSTHQHGGSLPTNNNITRVNMVKRAIQRREILSIQET